MAATEGTLGKLHGRLAEAYIEALEAMDPQEAEAALLTSAAKFLKDNGIEAEAGDEELDKLSESASKVTDFPFDRKEEAA